MLNHIVLHVREGANTRYVVRWYGDTAADDTIEPVPTYHPTSLQGIGEGGESKTLKVTNMTSGTTNNSENAS